MQIRVLFPTVTLSRTIEGQDLWQIIKTQRQPLDETTAIHYMKQVAEAVVYLHRQQPPIIHRDIKPQNIKITPQGQAVLVDFGIAKMAEVGERTTTGAQGVTPGFSPPEQYSHMGTTALVFLARRLQPRALALT